mgnify:CR=1 FL=1
MPLFRAFPDRRVRETPFHYLRGFFSVCRTDRLRREIPAPLHLRRENGRFSAYPGTDIIARRGNRQNSVRRERRRIDANVYSCTYGKPGAAAAGRRDLAVRPFARRGNASAGTCGIRLSRRCAAGDMGGVSRRKFSRPARRSSAGHKFSRSPRRSSAKHKFSRPPHRASAGRRKIRKNRPQLLTSGDFL